MAVKKIYQDQDYGGVSKLIAAGFEVLAADPASPTQGQQWFNSTTNKAMIRVGAVNETIALESWVISEINKLAFHQGGYDASGGGLPVAGDKTAGDLVNLVAGDQWVISNGGTITGIQGDDVLAIGDKIEFLGGTTTDANNWLGIQRNIDESALGGTSGDRQVVNLVANTALTVASSSVTDIHGIQVYDSAGVLIDVCIEKTGNANERNITSNQTLAGVIVELLG